MPPIPPDEVKKQLGEIIVANNPAPAAHRPMQPPPSTPASFKHMKFRLWPAKLQEALGAGSEFDPTIQNPANYQVEGVYEIDYVNEGEPHEPMTGPKIHRLWIIYGSGGK